MKLPIVSLAVSNLSYFKHYCLGVAVKRATEKLNRKVGFIASGDLSHRLTPDAPAGYNPRGEEFDLALKNILERAAFRELFDLDSKLIRNAGECGFRSVVTLTGAFNGCRVSPQILSYEGPFGVGYLVASFVSGEPDKSRDLLEELSQADEVAKNEVREKESFPVRLARKAIECYVKENKTISCPSDFPEYLKKPAGVFVSLKKNGVLRGCIGTTSPTQPSAAGEIIRNAIQSATADPRFVPVTASELPDLICSVDILEEPEEISDESYLDPKEYGVVVKSGFRSALLLPDLEGIDTAGQQVDIARRKGGISTDMPLTLYRFRVKRYH